MARSYETWGEDASASPRVGDVVTIWRDKKSSPWGHTFFYAGETKTHIKGLGGNQNDAVTVALFPKSRVLAIRRPRPLAKSKTIAAGATAAVGGATTAGTAGVALVEVFNEAEPAVQTVNQVGDKVSTTLLQTGQPGAIKLALCIILGCAVLTIAATGVAMWRRAQDRQQRGH
jgi:hypothetical protein